MSSFTLNNVAKDVASAITRMHAADNEPTPGSDNMVTSDGVKTAIDSLKAGGIDINSFNSNNVVTGSTTNAGFDQKLVSNPNGISTIEGIHNRILNVIFPSRGGVIPDLN